MFIQTIQGSTKDKEGLRRQFDRWQQELKPGAKGYLGSTGGVAEDGTLFLAARFESEAIAQENSDRAEQTAWWNETSKYLDGEPTFHNYTDTEMPLGAPSDAAGFVQVMQGRVRDRERLVDLEKEFLATLSGLRPDLLGSVRGWDGANFTEIIYFTTEAEARKGEAAMASDTAGQFSEFMELTEDVTYIDLKDPWLFGG